MISFRPLASLMLACLFVLASCAVSLVPPYDGSLVQKLDQLNGQTLALFASVEEGASRQSFSRHEGEYNSLIGGFEAAIIQAKNRDVPALGQRLLRSTRLGRVCGDKGAVACLNTTPDDLADIADGLRTLRNTHKSSGLDAGLVGLFKMDYEISINAALTIEAALER